MVDTNNTSLKDLHNAIEESGKKNTERHTTIYKDLTVLQLDLKHDMKILKEDLSQEFSCQIDNIRSEIRARSLDIQNYKIHNNASFMLGSSLLPINLNHSSGKDLNSHYTY